jgi:hypothetical protein
MAIAGGAGLSAGKRKLLLNNHCCTTSVDKGIQRSSVVEHVGKHVVTTNCPNDRDPIFEKGSIIICAYCCTLQGSSGNNKSRGSRKEADETRGRRGRRGKRRRSTTRAEKQVQHHSAHQPPASAGRKSQTLACSRLPGAANRQASS